MADRGQWVSSFHEGSFLGLHFSPILVIPALIERLVGPDVRVLNLVHAAAVAALVPATFLFLRALLRPSRHGPALAAVLAVGIPVWGTMQDVIRSDFNRDHRHQPRTPRRWAGLTKRHRAMWASRCWRSTREDVSTRSPSSDAVTAWRLVAGTDGSSVAAPPGDRPSHRGDADHPVVMRDTMLLRRLREGLRAWASGRADAEVVPPTRGDVG